MTSAQTHSKYLAFRRGETKDLTEVEMILFSIVKLFLEEGSFNNFWHTDEPAQGEALKCALAKLTPTVINSQPSQIMSTVSCEMHEHGLMNPAGRVGKVGGTKDLELHEKIKELRKPPVLKES